MINAEVWKKSQNGRNSFYFITLQLRLNSRFHEVWVSDYSLKIAVLMEKIHCQQVTKTSNFYLRIIYFVLSQTEQTDKPLSPCFFSINRRMCEVQHGTDIGKAGDGVSCTSSFCTSPHCRLSLMWKTMLGNWAERACGTFPVRPWESSLPTASGNSGEFWKVMSKSSITKVAIASLHVKGVMRLSVLSATWKAALWMQTQHCSSVWWSESKIVPAFGHGVWISVRKVHTLHVALFKREYCFQLLLIAYAADTRLKPFFFY